MHIRITACYESGPTPLENKEFTAPDAAPTFMRGGAPRAHEVLSDRWHLADSQLPAPFLRIWEQHTLMPGYAVVHIKATSIERREAPIARSPLPQHQQENK